MKTETATKIATVKIYTIYCTKAGMMCEQHGPTFSLRSWGANTDRYEGCDDGGVDYILPAGFKFAESMEGCMEIYFSGEPFPCVLQRHSCGRPQLFTSRGVCPVLVAA